MIRRILLSCLALLLATVSASAKPAVTAVRVGVYPEKTRVVLELTEAPRYRVFTLADPERVVIDLPELEWPENAAAHASRGLISALRYGLFTPGTSRVVLDLKGPAGVQQIFVLPPRQDANHRLVLDLAPLSREAFLSEGQRRALESSEPLPTVKIALPVPPPKPEAQDRRPVIVIDPGHGGVDPGALGVSGAYEKELTLAYGRELKKQLLATGRYRVVMTREDDRFIPLRGRVEVAQRADGDLFVSLHANTHASGAIRGAAIYTLSETASDAEAEALAAKENKSDIIAGINFDEENAVVSQILIDLAQRETMNLSKSFANVMVEEVGRSSKLLRNTHRSAGFAVLKSPVVPSVLFEVGYMSNPAEERQLRSAAHRRKVVAAMVEAIRRYFEVQEALRR